MKALDMHASDEAFERRLSEAVLRVIDTHQSPFELGNAKRSIKAMQETINPRSAADFDDILASHSLERNRTDDDVEYEHIEL